MNKVQAVWRRRPRLGFKMPLKRQRSTNASATQQDLKAPCLPERRALLRSNDGLSDHLLPQVLRVFEEAATVGKSFASGEVFTYSIPHELLPSKGQGIFVMALFEGGYEVGLVPLYCEIASRNHRRSGTLIVRKCA